MPSRREFLARSSHLAAAGSLAGLSPAATPEKPVALAAAERVTLDGRWEFRLDPGASAEAPAGGWSEVAVPHTWQIAPDSAEYMGVAWYRRQFEAFPGWRGSAVRVEFEAVFHSAIVWLNGREAGRHTGLGYTAFTCDLTPHLRFDAPNVLTVRVDNAFDQNMLPRGRSSDWTHDGGIYRPVSLLVTPLVFLEHAWVDAIPETDLQSARLEIGVVLRNAGTGAWHGRVRYRVVEEESGLGVLDFRTGVEASAAAGEAHTLSLPAVALPHPRLWHFDHPDLYRLQVQIENHTLDVTFGIRRIEVRDGGFYLNGERVRLMGVERMAGGNPEFGMAEPAAWLTHDLDDLKKLNCVFTRVHWQQDRRVLDYCDRHGMLIQIEVPAWAGATFEGMEREPSAAILENGLAQLREMIRRDRHHPCVFSWGLCNEINGQNPPAYQFVRHMAEEARKLDPHRLLAYASNSLQTTPQRDAAGLLDFIEWNEYYESWTKGTPEDMRRNLEEIHSAFPDKPIVISEYGYCACTAERPEGDARRISILREHDAIFRRAAYVGGLIFFCYNDYRTHIGDHGRGVTRQRIHGVVDLYGARKPSFDVLTRESSPVEAVEVHGPPGDFRITVRTREGVPAYAVEGYRLRAVLYGSGEIPLERLDAALPRLAPGGAAQVSFNFQEQRPLWIEFDVLRPTGFSAWKEVWKS